MIWLMAHGFWQIAADRLCCLNLRFGASTDAGYGVGVAGIRVFFLSKGFQITTSPPTGPDPNTIRPFFFARGGSRLISPQVRVAIAAVRCKLEKGT